MDGDETEGAVNEKKFAQFRGAADAACSILTNSASDKTQEHSESASPSPAPASPSQAQHERELNDSITVSQQDAVRALRKYTTLTNVEIFRRVSVSSSRGYRYLRGVDIRDKETRGRKRKLDETVVSKIIHEIESQPAGEKTKSWEELCKLAGLDGIAPITLKRAMESAGYYKCSHCQRVTKAHGMGSDAKESKDSKDTKDGKHIPIEKSPSNKVP